MVETSKPPNLKPQNVSWIYQDDKGAFGITMCPGKNMEKGRDGKKYVRDIAVDV